MLTKSGTKTGLADLHLRKYRLEIIDQPRIAQSNFRKSSLCKFVLKILGFCLAEKKQRWYQDLIQFLVPKHLQKNQSDYNLQTAKGVFCVLL